MSLVLAALLFFTPSAPTSSQPAAVSASVEAQIQSLLAEVLKLEQAIAALGGAPIPIPASLQETPATSAPSASNPSCSVTEDLSYGSSGSDVVCLQEILIAEDLLPQGDDTGYFGALTQAAVQQFQADQDIVSSGAPSTTGYGAVGPKTLAALASPSAVLSQAVSTQTEAGANPSQPASPSQIGPLTFGGGGEGGGEPRSTTSSSATPVPTPDETPAIASLSPSSLQPGSPLTITGTNFTDTDTVILTPALSASAESNLAAAAGSFWSGFKNLWIAVWHCIVDLFTLQWNNLSFDVRALTAAAAVPTTVSIPATSSDGATITVTIPSNVIAGNYTVTVSNGNGTSNGEILTVQPAAVSSACAPAPSISGTTYQVGAPVSSGSDDAQIQCAIDTAISDLQSGKASSATVLLQPNATYRLVGAPATYDALMIETQNLNIPTYSNFTFNGENATLSFAPGTEGIYLNGCEHCNVENFTMETDPNPMEEGTLASVSGDSLSVALSQGTPFSIDGATGQVDSGPIGHDYPMFRIADAQAFPDHLRFPALYPYVVVDSESGSSGVQSVTAEPFTGLPNPATFLASLPLDTTDVNIFDPTALVQKLNSIQTPSSYAATREQYPAYGPVFFTGDEPFAFYIEENDDLAVSNVTITHFAANGVHASYNRGPLVFDHLDIIPAPGQLRSVVGDGFDVFNNQDGPTVTNSEIEYPGDDSLVVLNQTPVPQNVNIGNSSVVLYARSATLESYSVSVGDQFNILNVQTGASFGTFTVTSATPTYEGPDSQAYTVTFAPALPSAIAALLSTGGNNAVAFIDLDQANSGATISNNLIMGGDRRGLVIGSSATVEGNTFVGLGLYPIDVGEILMPGTDVPGLWAGDFGPITVSNNTAIDDPQGFIRISEDEPASYATSPATLTATGNSVLAPVDDYQLFYAVIVDTVAPVSVSASGNTVITSTAIARTASKDFVTGTVAALAANASSWSSAFSISKLSDPDLWQKKCDLTQQWSLCTGS